MRKDTRFITHGALIGAIYVALTMVPRIFGLDSGAVQLRLSEALTVLPVFTPAAVPGLFVGCILSNLLVGGAVWDIVFGSLATLLGAMGTYAFRKKSKFLAPVFPIAANTLIVPFVLQYVYGSTESYLFLAVGVFAGELAACGVLGLGLYSIIKRTKIFER